MFDLVFFDDLSALEEKARFLEVQGFVIARAFKDEKELNELKQKLSGRNVSFKTCFVLDVPDGNLLQQFKKKVDLIAVKGGNPTMNGFAVKAKGVDFLLMPCSPNRAEFDRQTARNAADNGVPIAITFSDFLSANPFQRSQLLKNYSMVVKLCKKTGASCLFFTGARNATELRAPKDFAAFAQLLGFNAEQANKMVFEVPEKIFQE